MSKTVRRDLLSQARAFRFRGDDIAEIKSYLQCLDSPRSLTVWMLFESGEHKQLVDLETDPHCYGPFCLSSDLFRRDFLATKFLQKSTFLNLLSKQKRKKASIDAFLQNEEKVRLTNRRLIRAPNAGSRRDAVILRARAKIESMLGTFDFRAKEFRSNFDIEEWFDSCDWGPGVSTLIKGGDVSAARKYQFETGITQDLFQFIRPLMAGSFDLLLRSRTFSESDLTYVKGNQIITVPKNAKADRVIAVEPGWNIYFQKGIGSMLRRRLRRAGIDLNTQLRNQNLARVAAKYGKLATVDFSAASDTISRVLVEELLPRDWFLVMDACRSKYSTLDGTEWFVNHKFSSMGNGFTFELESMIFYAIAFACCELLGVSGSISVYGDDVIIPVEAYATFASVSEELGFSVNAGKSFHDSSFRESCGEYYFGTLDCKPLFLKERLSSVESVFKLANSVRRISHRWLNGLGCDSRLLPYYQGLLNRVPRNLRLRIPDGYGDGGFVSNFDEASPWLDLAGQSNRIRHGWEGYSYYTLSTTPLHVEHDTDGLLLARVRSGSPEMLYGNKVSLRMRVRRCVAKTHVPQWSNLGRWY